MSEYIKKIIEQCEEIQQSDESDYTKDYAKKRAYDDIKEIFDEGEVIRMNKWNANSHPAFDGVYLVTVRIMGRKMLNLDRYADQKWERYGDNVLAWWEIPEVYDAEDR